MRTAWLTLCHLPAGQHNDSRMNVALLLTAVQYGAVAANHCEVTSLIKDSEGKIKGARMRDVLTGREWETKSKVRPPPPPPPLGPSRSSSLAHTLSRFSSSAH